MTPARPLLATFTALGLVFLLGGPTSAQESAAEQERAYQDCMALARDAPADGLESAMSWAARDGGDGARHCAAVALIELGQYREAAQRLERLAADLRTAENTALGLGVLVQAGQAWILAGDTTRAHAVQSAALDIAPDNVELLLDRGITRATAKNYREAIDDLTRALDLAPGRPDVLVLRASAYRTLNALDLAETDITLALTRAPDNPDALMERGVLRRLAGDAAGARGDWLRVIDLAEGTATADAARANLARFDVMAE